MGFVCLHVCMLVCMHVYVYDCAGVCPVQSCHDHLTVLVEEYVCVYVCL